MAPVAAAPAAAPAALALDCRLPPRSRGGGSEPSQLLKVKVLGEQGVKASPRRLMRAATGGSSSHGGRPIMGSVFSHAESRALAEVTTLTVVKSKDMQTGNENPIRPIQEQKRKARSCVN